MVKRLASWRTSRLQINEGVGVENILSLFIDNAPLSLVYLVRHL